ncbi:MAG: hypothetical protein QXU98_05485 [Candidatus Parvarchaeota archaeon]
MTDFTDKFNLTERIQVKKIYKDVGDFITKKMRDYEVKSIENIQQEESVALELDGINVKETHITADVYVKNGEGKVNEQAGILEYIGDKFVENYEIEKVVGVKFRFKARLI